MQRVFLGVLFALSVFLGHAVAAQAQTVPGIQQAYLEGENRLTFVYKRDPDAEWKAEGDGTLVVRLFSDIRAPQFAAADIVQVTHTSPAVHRIEFQYKKAKTGLLVGVADPLLRIEYVDGSGNLTYQTVKTNQMTIGNAPNGYQLALYVTPADKMIKRFAIVAKGGNISLVYSARFDVKEVKIDMLPPYGTDLRLVFLDYDPLLNFTY